MEDELAIMLKTNFSKVLDELAELKRKVEELGKNKPQERQTGGSVKQNQFNQRTGGFSSEDVSIEKFFYAGKKDSAKF